MASPLNEGGVGGKFGRRPIRTAALTPYHRTPTVLRGVRRGGHVEDGGGWISKLVDPASRLIATGASKMFLSVFRKRLTGPARDLEEDNQSREDASQIALTVPLSGVHNGGLEGENQTNNSDSGGIAELEQLMGHKTFTRVEFDRLAELLRSRTVENAEHEDNDKKKEKPSLSVPEKGIGCSIIHENLSVPAGCLTLGKQIVRDEAASPAELAKAYVCSRPSKVPSSVRSLRSQDFQENAKLPSIPSTSKQLDLSVTPRPLIRFSGIPEHPEHVYQTARPLRTPGRSAIYQMSRSPYFMVNPTPNVQVGDPSQDGYTHPLLSQWTPGSMKSSGKQLLKRGSAALDDKFGSVGPIRRIRQKSNLMSPSEEAFSSFSGKYLCSPSTPFLKDISEGSRSGQKPLLLDERKFRSSASHTENGIYNSTVPLPQSSEKVQKLIQPVDKLLPSPKEKSSELKSNARDNSPSKLTLDMLHGSALGSTEDANFFRRQNNGSLDTASRDFHCQKQGMLEEYSPSKSDDLEVKLASEANGVSNASAPKDALRGGRSENIAVSNSIALPVAKKPPFRITAEDLLELDDDEYLPTSSTTPSDDSDTKKSKHNSVISETTISDMPTISSSQRVPVSNSVSFRKADKKALVQPVVTEKENGFVFPVTSDPSTQSQVPMTPTMPTLQFDKPYLQREHTPSPIFRFGSKDVNTSTVSSTTINSNNTVGINFGEQLGSELPSASSVGTCNSTPTNLAEGSALDESGKQMAGDTFNSSANTVMPAISTTASVSICQPLDNSNATTTEANSTASPSTGSNLFGSNASIQPTSSQNSTTTVFGASCGSSSSRPSISQIASFTSFPSGGLANSSSSSFGISPFGSATSGASPLTSSSGVTFSSSTNNSTSFAPATASSIFAPTSNPSTSVSTVLSSGSSASSPNIPPFTFGSSSGLSTSPFTGASSGSSSASFAFGLSSGPSTSPSTVGSSSGSSGSSFAFGLSSASVFSTSSSPSPVFGAQKPAFGLGSGSGNDQMNVEDSMTDVTNNAQIPSVPAFGQPANHPTTPKFVFGAPSVQAVASPAFQLGAAFKTPLFRKIHPH